METKVLEIENLKEQIYELQKESHDCLLKNIDLKRQIAMLKDGLEYQKNQADTFAKVLRRVWDLIDDLIDEFENADGICISDLKELKNSIPETALRRGE